GVEVALPPQVPPEISHVAQVKDRLESQRLLHAERVVHQVRLLAVFLEAAGGGGEQEVRPARQVAEVAEEDLRVLLDGRVLEGVELEVVALAHVVEHAKAAADGGVAASQGIEREAE